MTATTDGTEQGPTAGGSSIVRAAHRHDLMTVLPAVPASLPQVRALLRGWLAEHSWPVCGAEDIELAVNEAITNVIEHAYPPDAPGTAILHAWVSVDPLGSTRRVVATVVDRGRWAAHHPGDHPLFARGHGLVVMSGCLAELHIQRSTAGTSVIMVSAAAPPGSDDAARR
jgi:anti-sigma regulatory factor (Ser/Thr protein kinase)